MIRELGLVDTVSFSVSGLNGAGTGQSAVEVYIVTGGDTLAAAQWAAQQIAGVANGLRFSGQYTGAVSIMTQGEKHYIAVLLTVEQRGGSGGSGGSGGNPPIAGGDHGVDDWEQGGTVGGEVTDPDDSDDENTTGDGTGTGTGTTSQTFELPATVTTANTWIVSGAWDNWNKISTYNDMFNALNSSALKDTIESLGVTTKLKFTFSDKLADYLKNNNSFNAEDFHKVNGSYSNNPFSTIEGLEDKIRTEGKTGAAAYLFAGGYYTTDTEAINGLAGELNTKLQDAINGGYVHLESDPERDLAPTWKIEYQGGGTTLGMLKIQTSSGNYYIAVLMLVVVKG